MTPHLSAVQIFRAHFEAYQRVAWFLVEWAEREQRVVLRQVLRRDWPPAWRPR
jgi:hypothetical protein